MSGMHSPLSALKTINQLEGNDDTPLDGQITEDVLRSMIKRTKNVKDPDKEEIFN